MSIMYDDKKHHNITVVVGHIVFLAADSRKPLFAKLWSNRLTLCWSSAMVFPQQYMSSASLATTPSSSIVDQPKSEKCSRKL